MKIKSLCGYISMLLLLTGCGTHRDDPAPSGPAPGAAVLLLPAQNSVCVTGAVLSATQSTVLFQWANTANADSYVLTINNLLSGQSQMENTSQTQATISLPRNTPFSWTVTAKSTKNTQTTTSDSWKFYNAGAGVTSYAPFPADQLSPAMGDYVDASDATVLLSWSGSDPDNDIVSYDVYFGTTNSPPLLQQGVLSTTMAAPIIKSKKYYWKVVTHDSQGNTSESETIQFNAY